MSKPNYDQLKIFKRIEKSAVNPIAAFDLKAAITRCDLSAAILSNSLIHILSLSNSHNNIGSLQKNQGDKLKINNHKTVSNEKDMNNLFN